MVTCPKCGAANTEPARFCGGCGGPLPAGAGAPPGYGTVPGKPMSGAMKVPPSTRDEGAGPRGVAPTDPGDPAPAAAPLAPLAGATPRRAPAGQLPAGTIIDQKYAIERVLGEGGMGVVYLSRDVHTGLHVVLKAVRQELAHRADIRARTLAEGRALATIDHPNVVHLNAVVEGSGGLWLVMQYIDGESLDQTIARHVEEHSPMPLDLGLSIFRQIAAGISAAHREGVIHRDLKPANVMIRRKDGVAKVTDFGIAKEEADALAGRGQTKGIIGSLYYMSPEQVSGRRDLDKRVDIYALGILLYEMLVGHVPFDSENDFEIMRLHIQAPMPSVRDARQDVPPEVDALIRKACAKDRADRFSSCEELLAALDALRHGAPAKTTALAKTTAPAAEDAEARGAATTTIDAAPARRRRWPAAVIGLIALASGTVAALFGLDVLPERGKGHPRGAPELKPASPSARPSARPSVRPSADDAPLPAASPAPSAAPAPSPLEELAGTWIGNGRELEAVVTGDALEFRVVRAAQFAPQDYQVGEARFSLREIEGEPRVFEVEDRIRFIAPGGTQFDPARARGTCQDVRPSVDGRPLRATFDGARLSVEFARIEPTRKNFVVERGKVVSCVRLSALPATRVVSTLSRL